VPDYQGLSIRAATQEDLPAVIEMAGQAFVNERFHVDPRLPSALGDLRYQNWVRSSVGHAVQQLHVVHDSGVLVAFFVIEILSDGCCYWHLNAIAPGLQGRGYGRRAWLAMIAQAWANGAGRIKTTIVVRNNRVLNLYSGLGFRFSRPAMTFHWVRE